MATTERELANLADALAGRDAEMFLPAYLAAIRARIKAGEDVLGDLFIKLRPPAARRALGATYTPAAIVRAMVAWAAAQAPKPTRIVDPGAGSGRFLMAAAAAFPAAALVAVENDTLACRLLRANAAVLGFADRLTVIAADYRAADLPPHAGPTLFIGNPPYVRHHALSAADKSWLQQAGRSIGVDISARAGLHIHFFVRTRQLARPGDFGAFITAAEWLDVNYGAALRGLLADGLGATALHVIDPKARPFDETLATGAITCFRVGAAPPHLTVRKVASVDDLAALDEGTPVAWNTVKALPRWSILVRTAPPPDKDHIELGELFRVHRGQVTGCNAVWIAGAQASHLPARYLLPAITQARDLFAAGDSLSAIHTLQRVVSLPVCLEDVAPEDRLAVEAFLAWARQCRAHQGYVATHRPAWWAVTFRDPAPILCTYMARRAPAFVRNQARVHHLNIAHGLYPVEPLSNAVLDAVAAHLRATVHLGHGRAYAGGLVKFEPSEVARLHIPAPQVLAF